MRVTIILVIVSMSNAQDMKFLGNVVGGTKNIIDGAQTIVNSTQPVVSGTQTLVSIVIGPVLPKQCDKDITSDFQKALDDFTIRIFKVLILAYDVHFACSPVSMWMALAAVAEGSDALVQKQLFEALNLPQEICLREKFYILALRIEPKGFDVILKRKRVLLIDEDCIRNTYWEAFVKACGLIEIVSAPLKKDPTATIQQIENILKAKVSNVILSGNSIIIDTLDYKGFWDIAFNEAETVLAPFHDDFNVVIGQVELMKKKINVKTAIVVLLNFTIKIVCLPVGRDGKYFILLAYTLGTGNLKSITKIFTSSIFVKILTKLKQSTIPLIVAIPKWMISFVFDSKKSLGEIGIPDLWTDVAFSRNISTPAALPSAFLQRTSLTIDEKGLNFPEKDVTISLPPIGVDPSVVTDFIADKPFVYGLFNTEFNTCLYVGAFSKVIN